MSRQIVIGVDFDGTVVDHQYPEIGTDIGAVPWLKAAIELGANLVLFTMRSGETLQAAVNWYESKGVPIYGVNINPTQHTWTTSPKAYCHIYVDDAALGIALRQNPRSGGRDFVDWSVVGPLLLEKIKAWNGQH